MENRILYFDILSGISGDMTIGALLDLNLGMDIETLEKELLKLDVHGYTLVSKKTQKNGITGTKFDVILDHEHHHSHEEDHEHSHHNHGHSHEKEHEHSHHGHSHHHSHEEEHSHEEHTHSHSHEHRSYKDIVELINKSTLNENVKKLSLEMFLYIGEAEAKVHDKTLDEIHFHEVGAIDSIVDIVGTAICIDAIGVDEIVASPVHVGTGFVKSQHGVIPVPAPATLEILKNIPIYSKGIRSELVTPTGATIVKTLASDFLPLPTIIVEKIGYGHGTKDLEITNSLRVIVGKKKL